MGKVRRNATAKVVLTYNGKLVASEQPVYGRRERKKKIKHIDPRPPDYFPTCSPAVTTRAPLSSLSCSVYHIHICSYYTCPPVPINSGRIKSLPTLRRARCERARAHARTTHVSQMRAHNRLRRHSITILTRSIIQYDIIILL